MLLQLSPRTLLVQAVCLMLGWPRLAQGAASSTSIPPLEFWTSLVKTGVLDGEYMSMANCEGGVWGDFRNKFDKHVRDGRWNWADDRAWVQNDDHWKMIKAAELMLEMWRRADLTNGDVENLTLEEAMNDFRRHSTATPFTVLDPTVLTTIAGLHLERISNAPGTVVTEAFGAQCLLGLLAAIVVFGRALNMLSDSPFAQGPEDGFTLWRAEHGYIVAGLMLFEGTLLIDLTVAPGWAGVDARFLEQVLHWRTGEIFDADNIGEQSPGDLRRHVTLGQPRVQIEERASRLPPVERMNRAVDPMCVTKWGQTARIVMERRSKLIEEFIAGSFRHHWHTLGPSWVQGPPPDKVERQFAKVGSERLRVLAFVSVHGSLDLEIPSLLEYMFPAHVNVKYLLFGEHTDKICGNTQDSAVVHGLCKGRPAEAASETEMKWSGTMFEGRSGQLLSPRNPSLLFPSGRDGEGALSPQIIACTSWIEGIWVARYFPEMPLLLNFGPPLLLHMSKDITNNRRDIMDDFWLGLDQLYAHAERGLAIISAESLFRAEQLLFQSGIEVPFLRPMSVWVNATYSPKMTAGPGHVVGQVLIHNRGRLRYETFFIESLKHMVGSAFKYDIVPQQGRLMPFAEIAKFHAVVIVPWSPELCILRNIFKMRVPLFVPGRSLLRNMVHVMNQRLMPTPYFKRHPRLNTESMAHIHPYDPFLDTARPAGDPRGVAARTYWAEYSEFLLVPCLRHFVSAADLLISLHSMEGLKISVQMRAAYLQDMQEMRSFWLDSLANWL